MVVNICIYLNYGVLFIGAQKDFEKIYEQTLKYFTIEKYLLLPGFPYYVIEFKKEAKMFKKLSHITNSTHFHYVCNIRLLPPDLQNNSIRYCVGVGEAIKLKKGLIKLSINGPLEFLITKLRLFLIK